MVSDASLPARPPMLPFDETAFKLVLTSRGSSNALVFERAEELDSGSTGVPLTLSSHPGLAVVPRGAEKGPVRFGFDKWMYVELGVGSAKWALTAKMDKHGRAGFIASTHATPSMVLDISFWQYEEGNEVNLVGEATREDRSRDLGGGRSWVINSDGTISAALTPNLVLGLSLPDVTLVGTSSADALVFKYTQELLGNVQMPLTLKSHPGYGVCSKPVRRIDEWGVSYSHWGVGDAAHALVVQMEDTKKGAFVISRESTSRGFVLDVPFDKREEGTGGDPLAAISFDDPEKNKEAGNKARLFRFNPNGTVSPEYSPHLVLGLRPGACLLPLSGDRVSRTPEPGNVVTEAMSSSEDDKKDARKKNKENFGGYYPVV